MAVKKISELPVAGSVDISSDDVIVLNDGTITKQVTLANFFTGTGSVNVTTNDLTVSGVLNIPADSIGSQELNVSGSGTTDQFLRTNGDGSFTWDVPVDTQPNDSTITLSAGGGVSGGGAFTTDQSFSETITISHADTSTQVSLDSNTETTVIQNITLDTYGHITSMATADLVVKSRATGGGNDEIFYQNDQVVTTDYTIPSDKNAMSTGPIDINSGITVTIPDGARWVVL